MATLVPEQERARLEAGYPAAKEFWSRLTPLQRVMLGTIRDIDDNGAQVLKGDHDCFAELIDNLDAISSGDLLVLNANFVRDLEKYLKIHPKASLLSVSVYIYSK